MGFALPNPPTAAYAPTSTSLVTYAERRMRHRLAELPPGTYRGEDFLDDDGSSDEPVRRVSLQSERRRFAPYGLHGGGDGKPGRNAVIHADGTVEEAPDKATLSLGPDEIVVVETPGRRGVGAPPYKRPRRRLAIPMNCSILVAGNRGNAPMAEPAIRGMTVDEFLRWEDRTDTRYELVGGFVVAMAPPAARHSLLATALAGETRSALRSRPPCRVYGEAGIIIPDRADTCYVADLAATCEPLQTGDRLIRNPFLIVEILSPSTAAFDRQTKVADYRGIASVQEILLIDSETVFAEVLRRDGERWITEIVQGPAATLSLSSVPLSVQMAEIYEGIPMPEPRPRQTNAG